MVRRSVIDTSSGNIWAQTHADKHKHTQTGAQNLRRQASNRCHSTQTETVFIATEDVIRKTLTDFSVACFVCFQTTADMHRSPSTNEQRNDLGEPVQHSLAKARHGEPPNPARQQTLQGPSVGAVHLILMHLPFICMYETFDAIVAITITDICINDENAR